MAYKKTFRRRRNTRRKRGRPNVKQVQFGNVMGMSVPQMAKYGAVGYNILKGLINSELKRFDTQGSASVLTSPSIGSICDAAQGDDVGNRNGNKVLAKYLDFDFIISMDPNAPNSYTRILIFVDTENQGTAPTAADLLTDPTTSNNLVSRINVDNTQRFTVLFDKVFNFSNSGSQNVHRKVYRGLNFHINYTGSAGSTRNKNSIWLMHCGDEASLTPTLVYSSRLAFYDN